MKLRTVAILTNFAEFVPGYSLTGIVVDQAHMLLKNGHKVIIYVNENFNPKYNDDCGINYLISKYPDLFKVLPKTKFLHLTDYQEDSLSDKHKEAVNEIGTTYFDSFQEEGVSAIFTHDFIFTGWNLPYYHAIKITNNLMRRYQIQSLWLHWIHSVPSNRKEWWTLEPFGLNHHIVFPNKTEIMRVAEAYQTPYNRVKIIPHIKDIRNWYDFSEDTREILDDFSEIMEAEVVQVYPCSTDRLIAKQLDIVIKIFGQMKKRTKVQVFLVIANQWATGKQRKEDIKKYIELGEEHGLIYQKDFLFTSELKPRFATGISRRMIREFQLLSNLFIFPTREESFGLVGPEAAFSGSLVIANRSLQMMQEVLSTHAPAFEFGSFQNNVECVHNPNYLEAVSMAILNRLYSNEAIMTKVYCRIKYNMDNLYTRFYLPLIG